MKAKVELFVNPHRFKEYAVKYRRHWWNKWQYVPTIKGDNAVFDQSTAKAVAKDIVNNNFDF